MNLFHKKSSQNEKQAYKKKKKTKKVHQKSVQSKKRKSIMAMQEEIQSNHLLMWLHQSTLRILVMLNHFLKCNMLPRPVLNENVACVQEKVFFFPESLFGEIDMRRVSCSSQHWGRPHRVTQRMAFVCLCVCVGEWCTTEGYRATPTHQSHNHTLTINRGRKRKTSHGYIKNNLAYAQHTDRNATRMKSVCWGPCKI